MNAAAQLDQEWLALTQRSLKDALPAWQAKQPPLRGFSSPDALLRFLHSRPPEETNEPLLALLALARDDQLAEPFRLAGRFLIQAMLPSLQSQAKRIVHPPALRDEVWELLLFYAWEAILAYPIERRRTSVGVNLVLQVLHNATRELRRANEHTEVEETGSVYEEALRTVPATGGVLRLLLGSVRPAGADPIDAETFVLAAACGGWISEGDGELILQNRVDGIPLRILARVVGVGYQALRKRRQRAERQLRRLLGGSAMSPFRVFGPLSLVGGKNRPLRAAPPTTRPGERPPARGLVPH